MFLGLVRAMDCNQKTSVWYNHALQKSVFSDIISKNQFFILKNEYFLDYLKTCTSKVYISIAKNT